MIAVTYLGNVLGGKLEILSFVDSENMTFDKLLTSFSFVKAFFLLFEAFVGLVLLVVLALVVKVMIDMIKREQHKVEIYKLTDLKLNLRIKDFFSAISDLYINKITIKLTAKIVWQTIMFMALVFVVCALLIMLFTVLVHSNVPTVTIVFFFLFAAVVVPNLITSFCIFNPTQNATNSVSDFKQVFGTFGGDTFNYIIFIILTKVVINLVIIMLIALLNTLFTVLHLEALGDVINNYISLYVTGFFENFYVIIAMFIVAFYKDSVTKQATNTTNF